VKEWLIPNADAEFVCAMEAVLEVYERPYEEENPVVALDETPQQLISEVRESFMDAHGVVHQDYEYKREGVADIYMVCEPLAGRREILVKENHNRLSWAEVVRFIAEEMYPEAPKITLIQDNLSAHKPSALYELLPAERARAILRRIEFVPTPKHGSWLNVAEIELSILKRLGLKTRVGSREELERQIAAYQKRRNGQAKKIDWQFTTADARVKLKRLYPPLEP
jgi:phage terminase large subunit GpA-like protein